MENGAYSITLKQNGHFNGATIAYLMHLLFFSLGVLFINKINIIKLDNVAFRDLDAIKSKVFFRVFILLIISFIIVWFVFGGINVVLGVIDKAQFRTGLGPFGAVLYLLVKSIVPTLLAYYSCLIIASKGRFRLYFLCFFASLLAIGLGFKALAITIVLPSFFIIFRKIGLFKAILFTFLGTLFLFFTALIFSKSGSAINDVAIFLVERATVIQGDVAWFVWGRSEAELEEFSVGKTLIPFVGENIFGKLSDITHENYNEWINYHFAQRLTRFVGYPDAAISYGFTVTGSVFSTAVIVFGKQFFWLYSFFTGIVTMYFYKLLIALIETKRYKLASVISSYLAFSILGWINSGEIIKLIHISSIFYLVFSYFILLYIDKRFIISHA